MVKRSTECRPYPILRRIPHCAFRLGNTSMKRVATSECFQRVGIWRAACNSETRDCCSCENQTRHRAMPSVNRYGRGLGLRFGLSWPGSLDSPGSMGAGVGRVRVPAGDRCGATFLRVRRFRFLPPDEPLVNWRAAARQSAFFHAEPGLKPNP